MLLIGMAALIVGLSVGYYFFRKSSGLPGTPELDGAQPPTPKAPARAD